MRNPQPAPPEPPIYTFRVRILGGGYAPKHSMRIVRDIEIAANLTLADLGEAIPLAFEFDDPHMWSFYFNGRPFDSSHEYTLRWDEELSLEPLFGLGLPAGPDRQPETRDARATRIDQAPYPRTKGKDEMLYIFDYGDEWRFGVRLDKKRNEMPAGVEYPRVVFSQGDAPPQYPPYDEDEEYDPSTEDGTALTPAL